jgi:xanthine dehydrogenase molybdenum-binding subunit
MADNASVIGQRVRDKAAFERVNGTLEFSNDVQLPGMLHARLLKSPHARARVISVDASAAAAVPGVKLVMTKEHFPGLFPEQVCWVGQDVACVVAKDLATAETARELIKVEYEVLPFVIDPYKAREEGAPQVMPDVPSNVSGFEHYWFSEPDERGLFTKREVNPENIEGFGDLEEAKKDVDTFVSAEGFVYAKAQAPLMATTGCVANYVDGKLTIHIPTQMPHVIKGFLAMAMKYPINMINIVNTVTGGGFGGRLGAGVGDPKKDCTCTLVACAASMALGAPVRLFYTREEEFFYYWSRSGMDAKTEIGFKADGTLVTMETETWRNIATGGQGCGTQWYDATATGNMLYSHNCKANKYVKKSVMTNSPSFVGWQGFGNPEVFFAVESTMDMAAEALGMDPVELRRRNHVRGGDNWLSLTYGFSGPQWLGHTGIETCLDEGLKRVPWDERKPASEKTGPLRHGIGMALHCQQNGGEDLWGQAIVKLNADGTATLVSGYQDIGQGGRTAQCQLLAETLGLPLEKVNIAADETDYTPYTHFQSCSSGTIIQGPAVHGAAMRALDQLLGYASKMMGVPPEALETKDGMIFPKGMPDKGIPWIAVFAKGMSHYHGTAVTQAILGHFEYKKPAGAMPGEQGAMFCELDVDTETGALKNIKMTVAQDCGRAINPRVVEAHYLGVHHGVEAMTGAEQILDPKTGKLLNDSYSNYYVATIKDYKVEPVVVEVPEPSNPYGVVGIGQAYQNSVAAAIGNAIYNAIGVRMKETPFTPARVLEALGKL